MSSKRNAITFLVIIGLVMFLAWRETPTPTYSPELQHELSVCRAHATNCHVEIDTDGIAGVYGTQVTITGPSVGHFRCQEDDPCWKASNHE